MCSVWPPLTISIHYPLGLHSSELLQEACSWLSCFHSCSNSFPYCNQSDLFKMLIRSHHSCSESASDIPSHLDLSPTRRYIQACLPLWSHLLLLNGILATQTFFLFFNTRNLFLPQDHWSCYSHCLTCFLPNPYMDCILTPAQLVSPPQRHHSF